MFRGYVLVLVTSVVFLIIGSGAFCGVLWVCAGLSDVAALLMLARRALPPGR
jgi:hypothetical protein